MSEAFYCVWDAETGGIDVHEDRIVQWFTSRDHGSERGHRSKGRG